MWLDATLAYLHFTAVFAYFAFLSIELYLVRTPLDGARVPELRRADAWHRGSIAAVVATGLARLAFGAKGLAFYAASWPLYAKLVLFAAAAGLCLAPSAAFRRWARSAAADPDWRVPDAERLAARRRLMSAVHIIALAPLLAAFMARGLS